MIPIVTLKVSPALGIITPTTALSVFLCCAWRKMATWGKRSVTPWPLDLRS